jgi:hypothetical protein
VSRRDPMAAPASGRDSSQATLWAGIVPPSGTIPAQTLQWDGSRPDGSRRHGPDATLGPHPFGASTTRAERAARPDGLSAGALSPSHTTCCPSGPARSR